MVQTNRLIGIKIGKLTPYENEALNTISHLAHRFLREYQKFTYHIAHNKLHV